MAHPEAIAREKSACKLEMTESRSQVSHPIESIESIKFNSAF